MFSELVVCVSIEERGGEGEREGESSGTGEGEGGSTSTTAIATFIASSLGTSISSCSSIRSSPVSVEYTLAARSVPASAVPELSLPASGLRFRSFLESVDGSLWCCDWAVRDASSDRR